jgi:uncharacterized protein YkwD
MKTAQHSTLDTLDNTVHHRTTRAKIARIITLPRLIMAIAVVCLLLQLQRGKSNELPKYSAPAFVKSSLIERVNEHRASLNVTPLADNGELNREAERYCEMIAKGNLQASLVRSDVNLSEVSDWDATKGVRRNVAVIESNSNSPALDVIRTWIANDNQANNIEDGKFNATGIGVVRRGNIYYVCEIFATK